MSSEVNHNEQDIAAAAKAITKALGYAENGGAPDPNHTKAGKTGELKSIFQFEPDTWKAYAKEYLGDENSELTPDNETTVAYHKVSDLLKKGYTAKQIASVWNSGDKDAYTGKFSNGSPSIGVNKKYGVKFNVPAYANTVNNYAKQFMSETKNPEQASQVHQQPNQDKQQAAQSLLSIIQQAKSNSSKNGGLLAKASNQTDQSNNAQANVSVN